MRVFLFLPLCTSESFALFCFEGLRMKSCFVGDQNRTLIHVYEVGFSTRKTEVYKKRKQNKIMNHFMI